MSGVKETDVSIVSDVAELTGEALGAAVMAFCGLAVGAGILTFWAGKSIVKGGIAAGKMAGEQAVKAAEAYEEYQRQKAIERKRMYEERLHREQNEMQQMIAPFSAILQKMTRESLLKDFDYSEDRGFLEMLQQGQYSQALDSVIANKKKIQRRMKFLQEQDSECTKMKPRIQSLQAEMEEMTSLFRTQRLPDSSWPGRLEQFRRELQNSTLSSVDNLQTNWSNWKLDVVTRLRSLEIKEQARLEIEALQSKVPCSPEEAEKIDPVGADNLRRLEQCIQSQTYGVQEILQNYRSTMDRHLAVLVRELERIKEQKQQQEAFNQKYAPKIAELEDMLELAQNEIFKRWAKSDLVFLQNSIEAMKVTCQEGNDSTIESQIENWLKIYDNMKISVASAQKAEERREYIVQSMKTVLPELGFSIQSIQSESDAKSNTIIKVVPCDNVGLRDRRQITISIPQKEKEVIKYVFNGYHTESSRVNGHPIVENDEGLQAVKSIKEALKPFGIRLSEPDWKGNPAKINAESKDLPDYGPEEEADWQDEEETRQMEMDF